MQKLNYTLTRSPVIHNNNAAVCSICDDMGWCTVPDPKTGALFASRCKCQPDHPEHAAWQREQAAKKREQRRQEAEKKRAAAAASGAPAPKKPRAKTTAVMRRQGAVTLLPVARCEMNIIETPPIDFSRGRRRGAEVIIREWTLPDGTPGGIMAVTSPKIGLPTPQDLDVLIVLTTLSYDGKPKHAERIRFDGARLMDLLGRPKEGWAYKAVRQAFERWRALGIQRWAGWYDRAKRKRTVTGGFTPIAAWNWPTQKEIEDGHEPQAWFEFSPIFRKSLEDGNIKQIDRETYLSIESPQCRVLYLHADRRLHNREAYLQTNEYLYGAVLGARQQDHSPAVVARHLEDFTRELPNVGIQVEVTEYRTTFTRQKQRKADVQRH